MLDLSLLPSHPLMLSEHCLAGAVHKLMTSIGKNGIGIPRLPGLNPAMPSAPWVPLSKACSLSELEFPHLQRWH